MGLNRSDEVKEVLEGWKQRFGGCEILWLCGVFVTNHLQENEAECGATGGIPSDVPLERRSRSLQFVASTSIQGKWMSTSRVNLGAGVSPSERTLLQSIWLFHIL
jgi:hypothetical protein